TPPRVPRPSHGCFIDGTTSQRPAMSTVEQWGDGGTRPAFGLDEPAFCKRHGAIVEQRDCGRVSLGGPALHPAELRRALLEPCGNALAGVVAGAGAFDERIDVRVLDAAAECHLAHEQRLHRPE